MPTLIKDFPLSVIVGAIFVAAIWVTTLTLVAIAFRRRGRRALLLAAIALGISLLGVLIKGRLERRVTHTQTFNGRTETRTSGWQIDSRWFFAGSGLLSLVALAWALKNRASASSEEKTDPRSGSDRSPESPIGTSSSTRAGA